MLALLALLAYLPELNLPLIADDYDQIAKGRLYGPISGWPALAADPLYRCRATSLLLTHWTERLLGISPLALNASSILLHVFNTWLVFGLGMWPALGWRVSTVAAGFFAIYHGHQEAVTWYAALPELLVFFFTLFSLLLWIGWAQSCGRRSWCYGAAILSFLGALASKESAVVLVPLLLLVLWTGPQPWYRRWASVVPFAVLALLYTGLIFASQAGHQHFHDGTFSLHAPFFKTLGNSAARLFWIWGLLSLLALSIAGADRWRRLLAVAFAWVGLSFLPYSFLSYMPYVPSRHTYLASAGLSLVVAAGFLSLSERFGAGRSWIACTLAALVLVHNCGYLWMKKRRQMMERAAPTEAFVDFVRRVKGPIYLHCFPYAPTVAVLAASFRGGRSTEEVIWDPDMTRVKSGQAFFCWEHGLTTAHFRAGAGSGPPVPLSRRVSR